MEAVALIRRLHQHRQWANHRLLEAAQQLDDEQLRRTFSIGQGSIWKTLTHLYAAEYVWLETLSGNENPVTPGDAADGLPGNQEGPGAMTSLQELLARWEGLDARWADCLAELRAEDLDDVIHKISSLSGQRGSTRRADILLHLCTHAQYTAAQAVNMMRHVGADALPDLMLITLARQESVS